MRIKYLLDPKILQDICKQSLDDFSALDKTMDDSVNRSEQFEQSGASHLERTIDSRLITILMNNLLKEYPFLYTKKKEGKFTFQWVPNTAAGATGWLTLIHASLREYLILFGGSNTTDGHSGRYWAEVYDTVLVGEMRTTHKDDPTISHVHKPGDTGFLQRRTIKSYSITSGTWMLEYARGNIPSMLPTGLMDNLSSNLDYKSFFWTLGDYGKKLFYKLRERRIYRKMLKENLKEEQKQQKIKKIQAKEKLIAG